MTTDPRPSWFWPTVLLAAATAAGLRFAALGANSFWYDEAYVDAVVARGSAADLFTGRVKDNGNPPLYFLVEKGWAGVAGTTEAGYRAPAAVFGVLAVPLVAVLGRRLHSPAAGAVAACLYAVSPFQVEMANEARVYSFVHFITVLDTWLLVRWLDSRRWADGLAYAAGVAVACYSHYYVAFFVFAHAVALACQPDRWRLLARWARLMVVAAALWSPWAPAFADQLAGRVKSAAGLPAGAASDRWQTQVAATPVVFALGRTFGWRDAGTWELGLAAGAALVGFWVPAAVGLARWPRPGRAVAVPLVAAWVVLPVAIPVAAALAGKPFYHHRYGSVGLPGFVLAVAAGLVALPPRPRRAAAAVIAATTAYSLVNFYTKPIKDDWRAAVPVLLADLRPGEVVVLDKEFEVTPFLYYARRPGPVPAEVYGAYPSPDRVLAVRFDAGDQADRSPRDYTDRVLAAPGVRLGLVNPTRDLPAYRAFFEGHGFRTVRVEPFYRVTAVQFEKPAAP